VSGPFDAEAHVDHMAEVMGLDIAPEWRASVVDNMAATAAIAEPVLSFPLDDHVEPAPVFEP
jgi:1-carboxybiuret hydrolase subunit AtzG-like